MKKIFLTLVVILLLSSCNNQICGVLLESGYVNKDYYIKILIDSDTLKLNISYDDYKNIGNFDYNLPYCINRKQITYNLKN